MNGCSDSPACPVESAAGETRQRSPRGAGHGIMEGSSNGSCWRSLGCAITGVRRAARAAGAGNILDGALAEQDVVATGRGPGMIEFNDLKPAHTELAEELKAALERVLASGWFILGPEVEA